MNPTAHRDRGSMLLLTSFVGLGLTAAVLAAGAPFVDGLLDRQRAMAAADAAALAGVTGGRSAASALATANGAVLVAWDERAGPDAAVTVTVTVAVDGRQATARATDGP